MEKKLRFYRYTEANNSLGAYEILPSSNGSPTIEGVDAKGNVVEYPQMNNLDKKRARKVFQAVSKNGLMPQVIEDNLDTPDVVTNSTTGQATVTPDNGGKPVVIKYENKRQKANRMAEFNAVDLFLKQRLG